MLWCCSIIYYIKNTDRRNTFVSMRCTVHGQGKNLSAEHKKKKKKRKRACADNKKKKGRRTLQLYSDVHVRCCSEDRLFLHRTNLAATGRFPGRLLRRNFEFAVFPALKVGAGVLGVFFVVVGFGVKVAPVLVAVFARILLVVFRSRGVPPAAVAPVGVSVLIALLGEVDVVLHVRGVLRREGCGIFLDIGNVCDVDLRGGRKPDLGRGGGETLGSLVRVPNVRAVRLQHRMVQPFRDAVGPVEFGAAAFGAALAGVRLLLGAPTATLARVLSRVFARTVGKSDAGRLREPAAAAAS